MGEISRYLDKNQVKLGRDRDRGGLLDFLKNRDRDRGDPGSPISIISMHRDEKKIPNSIFGRDWGGLPDWSCPYLVARVLEWTNTFSLTNYNRIILLQFHWIIWLCISRNVIFLPFFFNLVPKKLQLIFTIASSQHRALNPLWAIRRQLWM